MLKNSEDDSYNPKTESTREYCRVQSQQRQLLLDLVFDKQETIRHAANVAEIKYSTAKAIVRKYTKDKRKQKKQSSKQNLQQPPASCQNKWNQGQTMLNSSPWMQYCWSQPFYLWNYPMGGWSFK